MPTSCVTPVACYIRAQRSGPARALGICAGHRCRCEACEGLHHGRPRGHASHVADLDVNRCVASRQDIAAPAVARGCVDLTDDLTCRPRFPAAWTR